MLTYNFISFECEWIVTIHLVLVLFKLGRKANSTWAFWMITFHHMHTKNPGSNAILLPRFFHLCLPSFIMFFTRPSAIFQCIVCQVETRSSTDECSTSDQTIVVGLQIFLDHRSSRTIDEIVHIGSLWFTMKQHGIMSS